MNHKLEFYEDRKFHSETGYAFIDQYGGCHIIVYGEFLKKIYEELFNMNK